MKLKVGTSIRALRKQKGLTLEDLAGKTGINMDHIARIERGETKNPRIDTIQKIAKALAVDVDAILCPREAA